MNQIEFTHRSYLELLNHIRGLGRRIGPFRDFPESGPYVILRHDVDFSIAKAEEMAMLDDQAGVRSTFFVLLTAPYYNPLWEDNLQILKRIVAMGHEIGLHYDCSGFDALTADEQQLRLRTLVATLECHLDLPVTTIAQHKPTAANIKPEFAGYTDAYGPAFFKDIAYISDSRMMFRVPDVYEFFRKNPRCQAALHPIWWHEQPKTREEVFAELGQQFSLQFSSLIDAEQQVILEFLKAQSHTSRAQG